MQRVVARVSRFLVALVGITTAGLPCAAYDFVDLTYEGAEWTQVFGTNDRGQVVGGAGFSDGLEVGWVYDPKEQTFTDLPPMSGCSSIAMGINNSGVIVGYCQIAPILQEGFILKKGIFTRFAYPGFERTYPRAIGVTGLVTGYAEDDDTDTSVGFIYDPARGTFTDIELPDTSMVVLQIIAQGINARGYVVGNVILMEPDESAFYWYGFVREPSGAVTLFQVNGQRTRARGITAAGVITGWVVTEPGTRVGFVGRLASLGGFQEMTNVELIAVPFAGATSTVAEAIDNSGRIVGIWSDEYGGSHGFIATPVPRGRQ